MNKKINKVLFDSQFGGMKVPYDGPSFNFVTMNLREIIRIFTTNIIRKCEY